MYMYNKHMYTKEGRWFSQDTSVSSTNKTDRHDIAEILVKMALNTNKPTNQLEMLIMFESCLRKDV